MVRSLHQLAQEALKLSAADRLALATELIDSVDGGGDPEWEEAWLKELSARRARGSAGARPWNEVRKEILERLANR
jgi:putative addiction module component (TIGR02574 family)